MRSMFLASAACSVLALGAAAQAGTMHPELGARLAGMGEHGVVNLQVKSHDLCWTFELATKGVTGASIRDSAGMLVARLGSSYRAKGCAMVSAKAIAMIDERPRAYAVWVDTKGHPGDLRGPLAPGMVHA